MSSVISPASNFSSSWDLYSTSKSSSIRLYVASLIPYVVSHPPISLMIFWFATEHEVNTVVTAVLVVSAVTTQRKVLVFLDSLIFIYI